jgi:hypothetical protein
MRKMRSAFCSQYEVQSFATIQVKFASQVRDTLLTLFDLLDRVLNPVLQEEKWMTQTIMKRNAPWGKQRKRLVLAPSTLMWVWKLWSTESWYNSVLDLGMWITNITKKRTFNSANNCRDSKLQVWYAQKKSRWSWKDFFDTPRTSLWSIASPSYAI